MYAQARPCVVKVASCPEYSTVLSAGTDVVYVIIGEI